MHSIPIWLPSEKFGNLAKLINEHTTIATGTNPKKGADLAICKTDGSVDHYRKFHRTCIAIQPGESLPLTTGAQITREAIESLRVSH